MCLRGKDEEYALEKRVTAPEGIAQKRKVYANERVSLLKIEFVALQAILNHRVK